MNVDDLQLHLSDIAQLLRNAGAKQAAAALADFCQRLQPYRDRKLKAIMDLLDRAEDIIAGAPRPRKSTSRAPKVDPQAVQQISNRIAALYERATEPETTREHVEEAFAELERMNPSMSQLQELAGRIDIRQKLQSKKKAFDAMKQAILARKGASQRVHV